MTNDMWTDTIKKINIYVHTKKIVELDWKFQSFDTDNFFPMDFIRNSCGNRYNIKWEEKKILN